MVESADERAGERGGEYRPRRHDHLVEPMFEALRPGLEPPQAHGPREPHQPPGTPDEPRRPAWARFWRPVLAFAALGAALWAARWM